MASNRPSASRARGAGSIAAVGETCGTAVSELQFTVPFPEGMGDLRIRGAKKVRLLGDEAAAPDEGRPDEATAEPAREPEKKPAAPSQPSGRYFTVPDAPRGKRKKGGAQQGGEGDSMPAPGRPRPSSLKFPERTAEISSTNIFGLASRSEQDYPEAYRPVLARFWDQLTKKEREELIARQAAMVERVGYRDKDEVEAEMTVADVAYTEAASRRHYFMRRRRHKTGYEGKKQAEAERLAAPLERRYSAPEVAFRESQSIIKMGPLDTPVLVEGLGKTGSTEFSAPPQVLRRKQRRRKAEAPAVGLEQPLAPPAALPEILTAGAPKVHFETPTNIFGLTSRSAGMYPELYRDVSSVYWRSLTEEQRQQIMRVQATAMEKVGYERGTEKVFIQDFDPQLMSSDIVALQDPVEPATGTAKTASAVLFLVLILVGLGLIGLLGYGLWDLFSSLVGGVVQVGEQAAHHTTIPDTCIRWLLLR